LWGDGLGQVFVVGDDGSILRGQQGNWEVMKSPTVESLQSVWGNDLGEVFAVGLRGTLIVFDGISWTPVETRTADDLYAIWGSGLDLYVAGAIPSSDSIGSDIRHLARNTSWVHSEVPR